MDEMFEKSLGVVIDSPMEDFMGECTYLSYGSMVSLRNVLELAYCDLALRKDGILMLPDSEERKPLLLGLYAEMQKIEDKAIWLTSEIGKRKLPPPKQE